MDLLLSSRGLNTKTGRVLVKDGINRFFDVSDISRMRIALLCLDFLRRNSILTSATRSF